MASRESHKLKLLVRLQYPQPVPRCRPARLSRLLWEQKIAGSNPATEKIVIMDTTKYIKHFNPNTFIVWRLDKYGFLHYKIIEVEHGD